MDKKTEEKKSSVATKIICAKCGKEDFVSFVSDGTRKYYCGDCLKEFNLTNKKGKVKKVFSEKRGKFVFEFTCEVCGQFRKANFQPARIDDKILCKECESKQKAEARRAVRKKVVIV